MQPIKSLLKLLLERNKLKYMLFFHARTGSSTLKKILNTHPKICLYGEPFHNNRFINRENFKRQNKIPKHINTIDDLDIALKELSYKYNGIKQGIHNTNNKFCDHLLLNRNIKIIFLQRTNLLQMVISSLIAQKIQKWGGETKEWRKMVEQQKCEPFDIDFIQKRIQGINKRIQKYKQLLKDNNIDFYNLYYEDLYGPDVSEEKKLQIINEIFEFWGVGKLKKLKYIKQAKELLDPGKYKLNSEETYKHIPNILEIEKKLGSDETGWLFK